MVSHKVKYESCAFIYAHSVGDSYQLFLLNLDARIRPLMMEFSRGASLEETYMRKGMPGFLQLNCNSLGGSARVGIGHGYNKIPKHITQP